MVAVVDIANRALGLLGDRANVVSLDPPEGSAQADHVARFWPMVRDTALEAHDWSFASTYAVLAELAVDFPGWQHAYAHPNDSLIIRALRFGDDDYYALNDPRLPHFDLAATPTGTAVILTNTPDAKVRYTRRVADPTRYSASFVNAVTFLLAAYLAGPVVKGRAGSGAGDAMLQRYYAEVGRAAALDANQSNTRPLWRPSNARARGYNGGHYDEWPTRTDTTSYPGV